MRTILTTVGTSLLSNARRDLKRETDAPIPPHDLTNYLNSTPDERACAETNSLSRLLKEDDRIVFLHSDTEEGRLCAEVLRAFYEKKGYSAEIVRVPDLNYSESRFKMRGLRSLVATLIKQIQSEHKASREVLINATGGFKAEIAYATLVGLLFDVPVYYIHEAFRDIIEMPPTPISWDYSLLADFEEFFEWIDSEPRTTAEVEQRLRRLPNEIHLLLTDEPDGCTYLSPTGEAFYQAYRERVVSMPGDPILLSSKARATYESAEPAVREQFRRALRHLGKPELRRGQTETVRDGDCLIYPRGHRDERILYYEQEGKVYVCELTRHSDGSYERLVSKRVLRENYTDFQLWNE